MTESTTLTGTDLDALAQHVTGRIATPSDPDWDAVRSAWNLSADQRPEFVALPEDSDSVATIVDFARSNGLRVAPQGTGHNACALGDLSGTVLLRTQRMREVTVDPARRIVRVGAGVEWSAVTEALTPFGLAGRAGSSGSVGVVGYSLGGGYSWLGRRHGLAVSAITAAELVTGDGVFHRVDADHESELFWAVRGGSGNVGIVCALEFTAVALSRVYGGMLMFPLEAAATVVAEYENWTRDLDERATTCVRLLRLPPMPQLPDHLRGKSFTVIDGAIDAPAGQAERLLAPLRALGPTVDTFADMPAAALGSIHMDPPEPTPGRADGLTLNDLPAEAIRALLEVAGPGAQTTLLAVDLRHLGGAIGRPATGGGAVDHLPGRFLVDAVGIAPTAEIAAAVDADIRRISEALAPWTAERDYLNFRESPVPAHRFYDEGTLQRLRAVRETHDPAGIIRSGHELG